MTRGERVTGNNAGRPVLTLGGAENRAHPCRTEPEMEISQHLMLSNGGTRLRKPQGMCLTHQGQEERQGLSSCPSTATKRAPPQHLAIHHRATPTGFAKRQHGLFCSICSLRVAGRKHGLQDELRLTGPAQAFVVAFEFRSHDIRWTLVRPLLGRAAVYARTYSSSARGSLRRMDATVPTTAGGPG